MRAIVMNALAYAVTPGKETVVLLSAASIQTLTRVCAPMRRMIAPLVTALAESTSAPLRSIPPGVKAIDTIPGAPAVDNAP